MKEKRKMAGNSIGLMEATIFSEEGDDHFGSRAWKGGSYQSAAANYERCGA